MSFWPFKRKPEPPAPPQDCRDWNEDWQIGDIAECVTKPDGWHPRVKPWERVPFGARYTVVGFSEARVANKLAYFLRLSGVPHGIETTAFRKVRPQAKQQSEVVERILKAKPGKDRVREPSA